MTKHKNYPTLYKLAYALGKEDEIIPKPLRLKIPKQTIYYWRRLPQAKIEFLRNEFSIGGDIKVKDSITMNAELQQQMIIELARIQKRFIHFVGKENFKNIIEARKGDFVKLIESYDGIIPKKEIIKWFGVEKKAYDIWYIESIYKCTSSKVYLCAKRYPQQVTIDEYLLIEKALHDSFYDYLYQLSKMMICLMLLFLYSSVFDVDFQGIITLIHNIRLASICFSAVYNFTCRLRATH